MRLGNDKITVTKKLDEQTYVNSSDYGVNAAQQVLLEGSSYPPHIKSSEAMSLGPATLMIMAPEKGRDIKFGNKWLNALSAVLGNIPDRTELVKILREQGVSGLKDLVLLMGSRQMHRARTFRRMLYLPNCKNWS